MKDEDKAYLDILRPIYALILEQRKKFDKHGAVNLEQAQATSDILLMFEETLVEFCGFKACAGCKKILWPDETYEDMDAVCGSEPYCLRCLKIIEDERETRKDLDVWIDKQKAVTFKGVH